MKELKKLIKSANLNAKIELVIILLVNLVLIVAAIFIFILTHNLLFMAPVIFIILLLNFANIFRYYYLKEKNEDNDLHALVLLFRYLYVDVNNGIKVIDALERLKGFANLKINTYLNNLLESNDETIEPYLAFAHQFPSLLIEEMLVALFRYKNNAEMIYLASFNDAYFKLKKDDDKKMKERATWQFDFIKTTAIIGVAIIMLIVIASVIIMVGEFLYE